MSLQNLCNIGKNRLTMENSYSRIIKYICVIFPWLHGLSGIAQ